MGGAAALVLMLSTMAVFLTGVASEQRTCYFGPPPEPDPDNPDHWMKQVMREIRKRCRGNSKPNPAVTVCSSPQPLGMEDGTIQDDRITASNSQINWPAHWARLNNHDKTWITLRAAGSWIKVDFVESTVLLGVITQGFALGHITLYKVAYQKQPSSAYEHVTDGNGNIKIFVGNTDDDTPVTNLFDESVLVKVVRIEPTAGAGYRFCLRLELLGCRLD